MVKILKAKMSCRGYKFFGLWRQRKTKLFPLQKYIRDKRTHPKPQVRYFAGTTKENIQLTIRLNASTINVQKWLLGGNLFSSCAEDSQQNLCNETQVDDSQEPGHQEVWLGFPNPAQICYMNSSLQSLLTLRDFVSDVSCEEEAWGILPEAVLIRSFMDIVRCHHSVDVLHKLQVLLSFKDIISVHAQEFQDISQKDAHEFLTSVLDQMRDLTPLLSETAAMLGLTYNCPVREHLVFKMQNTRMCNSCGFSSMTFEDFTHLSLNLLPGASVQEMLEEYLTETELEYRCDCGASTSWQQYRFVTLPRVLILHVKRFHFTPLLHLVKLCHPILLFRELMLTSSQANVWYTLVSVISHLGPGGNAGHYISDGVHPEVDVFDPADRWLSYNDSIVTETTGATVCKKRRKTAYILFYQRQVRERRTHPGMKLASPSPQTFSCTEEIPAFTALWQTQNDLKTEDL
ncbi:hypothetical protein Q8A73_020640 [Channa argus]|nr:hypothetical protein Q8A73_020640 [Channa argus]